jgi:integrase
LKFHSVSGRGCEYLKKHSSGIYYFRRYTKETGEITKSLDTRDLAEAKKRRDQILGTANRSKARGRQNKTALERFDSWVERKRATNKSSGTITSILSSRNFFEKYLGEMMPSDVTAEWWEEVFIPETKFLRFKSVLDPVTKVRRRTEKKRTKPRKFYNDRKWMVSYLEQCLEDGLIPRVPKLIDPDPPRDPGKVYSDEEVELLLNMAQTEDLHLAILMAVTMGMRRGEIFGLQSNRVDSKAGVIRLKAEDTKIRKPRDFVISPACREAVLARAKAGPWVFPGKSGPSRPVHKDGYMSAWKSLKRITGVEGRFHFLRHTFLTKAFRTPGANAALICHYAGLSLEVAQKVYLHFDDEDSKQVAGLVSYDL